MVVRETSSEIITAADRVTANSRNSRPTCPPMNSSGMNTATSEMLIDNTVKPTSRAPSRAAEKRSIPCSRWRLVFSRTTMASSTTKPAATVRAIRLRLLRLKCSRYIAPKVAISETTVATAGITVARALRRKALTTSTTSTMAINRVISISRRDERMLLVESEATCSLMSVGSWAASSGTTARMLLTVWITLAPGCWVTRIRIAGSLLNRPSVRVSATLSLTSATSARRTGAPLRQAMIRLR